MEKRTFYAMVAVVALGALAVTVMRSPEKGQRRGPPPRPIAELKADQIGRVEVTNEKQEKTVLERTGASEWRVKEPVDWKADSAAVKQLVEGLEKLSFHDTASENADKHDELGVADGKAAHVVAKTGGGQTLVDLLVGKGVAGYTMMRVPGKAETWETSGLYSYMIGREPRAWRDHTIFEFPAADVEQLTVEAPGQKLVLKKEAEEAKDKPPADTGQWKIVETSGAAPKTQADLDVTQVNATVSGVASLKAGDFVDDKKRADVEGKGEALSVRVLVKGTTHTLFVGGEKGDDLYVATADSPTVYTVKKFSLGHVARRPIDYRDKTIVKAPEAELTSIEITTGGESTTLVQKDGKWTTAKGSADETKLKPVVSSFSQFVAGGFAVENEAAKTGLNKPAGTAVLHIKGKPAVTIKVGAATKDGEYYVQKSGSPDIFLVQKYAVERWMKKPAELVTKK
jgi:hypothetical protein